MIDFKLKQIGPTPNTHFKHRPAMTTKTYMSSLATESRLDILSKKGISRRNPQPLNASQAPNASTCVRNLCQVVGPGASVYEFDESKLYTVVFESLEKLETFLATTRYELKEALYGKKPHPAQKFNFFNIEERAGFVYHNYHKDFGPFSLAISHLFFSWLKLFFDTSSCRKDKTVVVLTYDEPQKKLNVLYLVTSAAIVLLNKSVEHVIKELKRSIACLQEQPFVLGYHYATQTRFNDVTGNAVSRYQLTLESCLKAWKLAMELKFYDFYEFDQCEYVFCERVEGGDLNWIVPNKIIAFCGPCDIEAENKHKPEFYFSYFRDHNVKAIIRLNDREYKSSHFKQNGFEHFDLIFEDGSSPSMQICRKFINIVDNVDGAVAVHCAAGIGRTGTLICAYLIARYGFKAETAIAWARICRPGSVIGRQQNWLQIHEAQVEYDMRIVSGSRKTKNSAKLSSPTIVPPLALSRFPQDSTSKSQQKFAISNQTTAMKDDDGDDNETVFSVTSALHGQARGLLESKSRREREAQSQRILPSQYKEAVEQQTIASTTSSSCSSGSKSKRRSSKGKLRLSITKDATNRKKMVALNSDAIDLGKSVPMMVQIRDYVDSKTPEDIDFYTISEAPCYGNPKEAASGLYKTWRIKYPKDTYFKLVLMQSQFNLIKQVEEEKLLDSFVTCYYCLYPGPKIIALGDMNASVDESVASTSFRNKVFADKQQLLPGTGGTVEFGFCDRFMTLIKDPILLANLDHHLSLICPTPNQSGSEYLLSPL